MDSLVKEIASIAKFGTFKIDNWVFQLHYIATCLMLFGFSILVTSTQFFGEPINCMGSTKYDDGIPEKVLNNYCWIHCTFTLPKAYGKTAPWDVVQPGIDTTTENDVQVYHAYYQWVCFFFALQGIFFYFPRFIWKSVEQDHSDNVLLGLDNPIQDGDYAVRVLARYLKETSNRHTFKAVMYFLCEALNFVNVVGQIFFTDKFLGHEFTTYGTEVIEFAETDQSNRTDPMIQVFPRVTKCSFRQFGVGGSVQKHDALCILPINIMNEKLFIFLWFWFVLLAIVSGLNLIYRSFFIFPWFRCRRLAIGLSKKSGDKIKEIIDRPQFTIGDYFLLLILKKNLASLNFDSLLDKLSKILVLKSEDGDDGKQLV